MAPRRFERRRFSLIAISIAAVFLLPATAIDAADRRVLWIHSTHLGEQMLVTPFGLYAALHFDFATLGPQTWLLLLFYSLAASVWTVWLWMTGLKAVPAAQGGVFTVMLPVSAALVGVVVLGESLGGLQLLAFALALAGVLLATLPVRSAATR